VDKELRYLDATDDIDLISLSPALAEAVAMAVAAGDAAPTFCLRRQRPYVLLGPQDLRLPHVEDGARWLEAEGYPVRVRVGGGAAVLLDGDCLSFFAAIPSRGIGDVDRNFQELTRHVRLALERLGAPVAFGRAPGSFCEGPQDLVTMAGRKIAGVSQALRRGYALVSGMLLATQDPARSTALLQEFYRRSGSDRILRPSAVTSLREELGRGISVAQLRDAIVEAAVDIGWDGSARELLAAEREHAEELLERRRFRGAASGTY
jgi:octanoyl-[GcvH]:protein N-octanoyltransferase